jgi:type I restriction enzyme S subunit
MVKSTKTTATPRLRFPEFRKTGGWTRRKLSELLVEQKERNRDLRFGPAEVLSVSGEHGCVNQIRLLGRSYAGATVDNYRVVETGDIVYTKSPLKKNPFGIIKENKSEPGIVSTLYAVYRATRHGHPAFLDHYFSGDYNINSYLQPIVRKGAKNDMKVNNGAVLSGEVFAPDVDEQVRIATCLTSLDEVTSAQGRKLEALKAQKRGLMQHLFPFEGETRPRLRFPEFRDAPEWKLGKANDIVEVLQGYGFPERLQGNKEGEFPFYKVSDISACVDAGSTFLADANNHIDATVLDELRARLIPVGTTVFAKIGEAIRSNKRAIATRPCLIDNNAAGVKAIQGVAQDRFVYYLWSQIQLIEYAGGVVPAINKSTIEQIQVCYPRTDEQQRIADFLTSLDTLISAESDQLSILRLHKKGMMQQLFPLPLEN